ncbi:RluA family pseudouridine synthase [Rhodocista pekingensis]|uniref:Pseudouridine synthase n=1 Tax=Rhodocista pekingensis TaxID=201185 RepID=A0ABW2KT65_9PROT
MIQAAGQDWVDPDDALPDDLAGEDDLEDGSPAGGLSGDRPSEAVRHQVEVAAGRAGDRLDKVLSDALAGAGLSRSRLRSLIDQGCVSSGGETIDDASRRVKPGQIVEVLVPAAEPAVPLPQAIPLAIVHEDDELLVIDKAAEMVVHPAAGNPDGTLVNALLAHCGDRLSGIGGVRRPGIVHRLDKGTSGLLVAAKTDRAHQGLTAQFADRSLSRTYLAVVWGVPAAREGVIEGNIGRHPADRKRMAVLSRGGKPAVTRYRVVRSFGLLASLVECKLLTGRTHQIRVHMAHLGHPLVGDPLYGRLRPPRKGTAPEPVLRALAGFPRQALHAAALEFRHPASDLKQGFTAALPEDLAGLIQGLETL